MKKFATSFLSLALRNKGYALCFLIIVGVVVIVALSSRGREVTDKFYDVIRTTETRNEVVIIGIDDASLQALGAWPWDREIFANLTRTLDEDNVRAIAYDVLFLEPRTGDDAFKKELRIATHPVILASKHEGSVYLSSYLIDGTTTQAVPAVANVEPDSDGKVRRYATSFDTAYGCVQSLSQQAFNAYTRNSPSCAHEEILFRYPSSITTYSLVDVLHGTVPKESLEGKVIFIGSTSLDLEDHFVGMNGSKIPGVYVHASMFTSLLNRVADVPLSKAWTIILLIFIAFLSAYLIFAIKSVYTQTASVIVLLLGLAISSVILFSRGVILPFPWLITDVILSAGFVTLIRFVTEQKQNQLVQSIFSKYVHKGVLKELMGSGTEIKLGGERKPITVLFSDLRGFTTLSESLSPEDLTTTLNGYLSAMTPHILEEKGTIDKFIGDAIMAFWNAPLPVENHPLHAVRSALRMHKALKVFNEEHGTTLAIGIGIHTGQAVVGNVGGKDRVNYTILGDTVNLASRIEGLTKKYGVGTIITMAMRDAIDDPEMEFRCLDVITVLGKSTPTTLYEVRYKGDFAEGLIEDYEKAFKFYYEKQWNKAEILWKKLAKRGDIPSEKMLTRIPELRKREDWDGIWRFDEK